MITFKKLALAAAAASLSIAAHAIPDIDLFQGFQTVTDGTLSADSYNAVTLGTSGNWSNSATGLPNIIGGQRDMMIEWTKDALGAGAFSSAARPSMTVGGGYLSLANGSGVGGVAALLWDGAALASNGSGVQMGLSPLALSPLDFFELNIINSDHAFGLDLYMFTSATKYSKVSVSGGIHGLNLAGTLQLIPIGAFADCNNSVSGGITTCYDGGVVTTTNFNGVDFTNVGALEAVINFENLNSLDLDITLKSARVVPEPGTIALVGAALLGLGAARRRKAAK